MIVFLHWLLALCLSLMLPGLAISDGRRSLALHVGLVVMGGSRALGMQEDLWPREWKTGNKAELAYGEFARKGLKARSWDGSLP